MLNNRNQPIRKKITEFQIPSCKYWILDTDVGGDDAQAVITMIHLAKKHNKEIVGITCVNGNAYLKDVIINTILVLAVCDAKIPIYVGCQKSLLDLDIKDQFFGPDGFGRQQLNYVKKMKDKVDFSLLKEQHAAKFIVDSSIKYKGDLGMIMIGPLTNLAMSYYIDPQIVNRVKMVSLMGGNYTGVGLGRFFSSEFNIHIDTVAAQVVFKKFKNLYVSSIELALDANNQKSLATLTNYQTPKSTLIADIYNELVKRNAHAVCDPMAVFVAFGGKQYVTSLIKAKIQIHQTGKRTQGFFAIDWERDLSADKLENGVVMFIGDLKMDQLSHQIMQSYK